MELAKGIHQFPTGPFNWYVIEEAGRVTLVDAGFPGHFEVFINGLRSIGRELKDVEAVILSHAHADHMGFADRVAKAAKAPVYIHQMDVVASRRPLQLPWFALLSNAWHPYMASVLGTAVWNGVFRMAHVSNPRPFQDGDQLDVPGHPLVIHTPGHTPGEVAFYLPAWQVLISGDSIVTQDLYTGKSGTPQLTRPRLNDNYPEAENLFSASKSLEKLRCCRAMADRGRERFRRRFRSHWKFGGSADEGQGVTIQICPAASQDKLFIFQPLLSTLTYFSTSAFLHAGSV